MKRWLRRVTLAALLGLQLGTPAMAQQIMPAPGQPAPGQYPPGMPSVGPNPIILPYTGTGAGSGVVIHNMIAQPPQVYPPPPVPTLPPWPVTINPGSGPRIIPPPPTPGPIEGGPWRQAIVGCLNSKGLGCQATHNTVGCGSCYGHLLFVFGSCRQFFGDTCMPIQPDGNRAGTAAGYSNPNAAGGTGGGCGGGLFSGNTLFGGGGCSSCGGN
ncbi:MAG TPA: hypothetical protein VE988_29050 [Gemmataceae bacterium]|nr:hypothetical protein [Gemmataceae bacterium]